MGQATSGIRNIALVGPAGAGKTSLAETLLLQGGAIRSRGSLQRGSTVSDFDPQEKRLQHSLDTAILSFTSDGTRINLIDTPGYPDFLGKTLSVLEAVEAVAIVVSAVRQVIPHDDMLDLEIGHQVVHQVVPDGERDALGLVPRQVVAHVANREL